MCLGFCSLRRQSRSTILLLDRLLTKSKTHTLFINCWFQSLVWKLYIFLCCKTPLWEVFLIFIIMICNAIIWRFVSAYQDKLIDNGNSSYKKITNVLNKRYGNVTFSNYVKLFLEISHKGCRQLNNCSIDRHFRPFISRYVYMLT